MTDTPKTDPLQKTKKQVTMSKTDRAVLLKAIDHIERMISGVKVGEDIITNESQELYLNSWVLPRLNALRDRMDGKITAGDLTYNYMDR